MTNHDELIARLEKCSDGRSWITLTDLAEAAAALRDVIAARNADFEVYHEMFMALFHAAPDKYRSGVEMAQDIIAQRDDLQRQLGEANEALAKIAAYDPGVFRPLADEIAIWRIATDAIDAAREPTDDEKRAWIEMREGMNR